MKIAIPTKAGMVDNHFGHCEMYTILTASEEKSIIDIETIPSTQGCGCKSGIAQILKQKGVMTMLAGGIGEGAINVLNLHGINVVRGCSGNVITIAKLFLEGKLTDSGKSCVEHEHHHREGHSCRDHEHTA